MLTHLPRSLPWLLLALLAALLLFNGARALLSAYAPVTTLPPIAAGAIDTPDWNWFGRAVTATVPARDDLPESRSGARLLGIVITGNDRLATLATGNAGRSVYREGESLDSGIRVERIEAGRVILIEQGERRQLALARFADATAPGVGPATSNPFLPPLDTGTPTAVGARLASSPFFGTVIDVETVPESLAAAVPLQSGDRIVSLDGYNLDHVARDPALRARLAASNSIPVEIERDGASVELRIDTSALPAELRSLLATEQEP